MASGTRGGDGRFERDLKTAQRDADAAALRAKGWTFQRIANELGLASKAKAYEAVQRAFADIPTEAAHAAKRLDLERIDRLIEVATEVMEREHVAVSQGRVVRKRTGDELDENGTPVLDADGKPRGVYQDVLDDGPMLAAMDRVSKLLERRSRMYGYDEPARSRVEVVTSGMIEDEIRELEAELQRNDSADRGAG